MSSAFSRLFFIIITGFKPHQVVCVCAMKGAWPPCLRQSNLLQTAPEIHDLVHKVFRDTQVRLKHERHELRVEQRNIWRPEGPDGRAAAQAQTSQLDLFGLETDLKSSPKPAAAC